MQFYRNSYVILALISTFYVSDQGLSGNLGPGGWIFLVVRIFRGFFYRWNFFRLISKFRFPAVPTGEISTESRHFRGHFLLLPSSTSTWGIFPSSPSFSKLQLQTTVQVLPVTSIARNIPVYFTEY